MKEKYSETISHFMSWLEDMRKEYAFCVEKEAEMNDLTQDLLHLLELQEHKYHDKARIAATLRQCRADRRTCKDTIQALDPLIAFLNSEKGKMAISQLQQALGAVRKAERSIDNRRYIPRVMSQDDFYKNEKDTGGIDV